ncbi:hypothetical protein AMTRI_Chr06g201460 [Amborella trichopoda]|uniref:Bromo domain-containing protein n=1 Tax=Amborella trichopoda TaxID=13333 RepID=U5DD63_AMBTC|nr:ATPase family AAA domain-containing protein At1g05910 [Amborella trichopoda]XP_020531955.1 ATPase family AAA domain-containing protein At1g05910 [Amborella trichopoda]ERN20150.1 hypothetical protein AMTR_s00066p00084950 [Amborella trichopoda]|eukprot:XP_006858683.1 ATPase family AAA domain-containing protein At1g05910 [Amborella trichopoda]
MDSTGARPIRMSNRLRSRPKLLSHTYFYYKQPIQKKNKSKKRTAASQIAKMLQPGHRRRRPPTSNSVTTNLRRSTRKRKISINLEDYETDNSETEDDDLMRPRYRPSKRKPPENNASHDDFSTPPRRKKSPVNKYLPRREGLRPRRSTTAAREQLFQESEDDQESSEERADQDEMENGDEVEGDGVDEGEGDGGDEVEGNGGEDREEDGEDEEGEEEEQDGRRRYDLRNRSEVRRLSLDKEKQRPRSPRRVLHQGMGMKTGKDVRKGGSRVHKRHRLSRMEDSDDSLLVDELDQGPGIPWMRAGNRGGAPWLFGGMDMPGSTAWGLNVAASGWGHQSDSFGALTPGVQTAGPSSKGGADIQPLQVDENVSFNDIGGLSEYIDALKEMVFFPLLYPDFFANYNITPPRGVLLCGPPGTGKTLIARALACAASKAGQKVSFYMRKGADVLSKWVGEAERQLKMLFEEAQRNQPSIIFFDEIDGLAPVRSSKQEQIHNSIVSTLLALMDGLDSRGQVVLIGATNRIDAIDGALRRPGRFDREFNFPLPGCQARAEILDIHTRKWKEPPSKELKMELAASCVGYCGADLKALCTEAAIRAFREKYPQVYTSDDKFVIDVDSVRVEKYHFLEAMSTITPAAHRGSIVHSRPLSPVVAPCLQRHLLKIMDHISDIFPSLGSLEVSKLSGFSYGSAMPLVYRPRLLLCGDEGAGLDHIGPAVLHELEKFPVHSLGLPALLSDPSAKIPEEALVHIFGEARRTTPSILYLPQFQLWWENAHEQLKAVLLALLEDLPSDFPMLLLGTSASPLAELDGESTSVFAHRNVYQVEKPTSDDKLMFFGRLVEAAFSILDEEASSGSQKTSSLPELPKAPKEVTGPKLSEVKAKAEAEEHALRRLRMCLRDVCNRIFYDKRFSVFHYPVLDEDAPNYRSIVQNPMDIATLLQRVDSGHYLTCSAFQKDVDLVLANAKAYNGDDYNGTRIVSRAYELRDAVHGMLSQMDPALVSFCDKIAVQGGPLRIPEDSGAACTAPVVQAVNVTRASARLRNVQPEVNLFQSYEVLKRQKRSNDAEQTGNEVHSIPGDRPRTSDGETTRPQVSSTEVSEKNGVQNVTDRSPENPLSGDCQMENVPENGIQQPENDTGSRSHEVPADQIELLKQRFVERADAYGIPQLERLYAQVVRRIFVAKGNGEVVDKPSAFRYLSSFVGDDANF